MSKYINKPILTIPAIENNYQFHDPTLENMQPFIHNDSIAKNTTANLPHNPPHSNEKVLFKLNQIQHPTFSTAAANSVSKSNPRAHKFYLDKTTVQPIKRVLNDLWSRISFHDAQLLRQRNELNTLRTYSYAVMDYGPHQYEVSYPPSVKLNDIQPIPPQNDNDQHPPHH